jgi:hypothetical protein
VSFETIIQGAVGNKSCYPLKNTLIITIEHIISSCTVLAQSEYKKRHDIFAKIIHMNLAVKFNLLKNTQPVIHQKVVWKMTVTSYILIEQF